MRCIPACLTPTSEGMNQCLIKANSSKVCLVINLFSIFLSLLVVVAGITALIFFSIELGVIHSVILAMCVLAAVVFLIMSSYYLTNRQHTIRVSALQDQRLTQDRAQGVDGISEVDLGNAEIVNEIQGELRSKHQQIEEMKIERQRMSARILELEAGAAREQENQVRIRGFEERERASAIVLDNERRIFESRIRDLEQAVSDAEFQSRSRTSDLETLQEERTQLQNRMTELETAATVSADRLSSTSTELQRQLSIKDEEIEKLKALKLQVYEELQLVQKSLEEEEENNGKIARRFEKLRLQLERERDELRIQCLNAEAKLVQLEISLSNVPNFSENTAKSESKIEQFNPACSIAEEKIKKLKDKLKLKKEEISTIERTIQQERQRHEEENTQLKQSQSEAVSKIRRLEQELAEAASERNSHIQAFRDKRCEYEKEIAELKNTCSSFENTICDLQRERSLFSDEDGDRNSAYRALRTELGDKIAGLQKENEEKHKKVLQLEEQMILCANEKMRTQRIAREQITHQVNKRKTVESELQKNQSKIQDLETQVERLRSGRGRTVSDLQEQIRSLNQEIRGNNETITKLESRNRELERTVQVCTNESLMRLTSDPSRSSSIDRLKEERKKLRIQITRDTKDRVRTAHQRIERLEKLCKGSALESQVDELAEDSERRINYQRIFELESTLLSRSNDSATGRDRVESMRALRLQQYCDGDAEFEARVRDFNFPPNAPIDSRALYQLEQEIYDTREAKLFSLREELEDSREHVIELEIKITELTEALRAHEENLSPNTIEKRSLAEQQEAKQVAQDLRNQLEESRIQLEDYQKRLTEAQRALLQVSLDMQSKDLALKIAEDKLKQFEDK
ncbi:chromosome segregation protein SMC,IncA protein [Chlamydia poikilotherma]|uniref:Chromosome segregation protein SMC,IncA protein n=1 Tax=Chlamydia poikilotherma TaxID=1967783 RepID=A0A3B0QHM5_9CHLA|nr:IncA family protein [Chlamydia poikilotherma]SYX09262.1 chromosome segregation protein SMC,IncA protein [Chlamydia poikilotherma]